MKQWSVSGHYPYTVEADTEEEAVEQACDKIGSGWEWQAEEVTDAAPVPLRLVRHLELTAEDMRDLIGGHTINAAMSDGEEVVTAAPDRAIGLAVIVSGNPFDGMTITGPFIGEDRTITEYAETHMADYESWWIVDLATPENNG